MECETVRELLGNYIDEDLTETLRRSVDGHLVTCPGCRADLYTLQKAVVALAEARSPEPPSPWFTERLLHRLAQSNETSLTPIEQRSEDLQLGLW